MITVFSWTFFLSNWANCSTEDYAGLTSNEKAIVELVNELRVKENVPKLKVDPLLNQVAKYHSQDMAAKKILDSGPPVYQLPFERSSKKRLSDINNRVVVAHANSIEGLKSFIQSDTAIIENLFSAEMTHIGVGSVSVEGNMWLTIHMVERVITFESFMLKTRSGVVPKKSITIHGVTPKERVQIGMLYRESLGSDDYKFTKVITPESDGSFSVSFDFDLGDGEYGFLFWVYENGQYRKSNYFDIMVK